MPIPEVKADVLSLHQPIHRANLPSLTAACTLCEFSSIYDVARVALNDSSTEALRVSHQLSAQRKMPSIEPLNLIDAGPGALRQRVDVDLAL